MTETTLPRLRHFTMLSSSDDEAMSIIVGTEHFELKEMLGSRNKFLEVKSFFDGRHTVKEISLKTGVKAEDIWAIVEGFEELGILRKETETEKEMIPVEDFLSNVETSCLMWQRQIGYHRLFSLFENSQVRREVFVGYLLESYHYVNSASKHTATALTHCINDNWKKLFTEYFIDEYDHGKLYLSSLEKMGLKPEHVQNAHPIIGTMSLINMLCEIARTSTLSYFACISLFEANKADFQKAKKKMETIGSNYGFGPRALADIISHMEQDIKMNHKSLLSQALKNRSFVDAREAHTAVNCLHDLKHSFDQFHDQILQYYGDISNYIPRLKVDYFSL